jgi:ketosteroid isomerase-like protein
MGKMTDGELRDLCNRFFDAYQDHVIEEVEAVAAPDLQVWMAPFNKTMQRDDWIAATQPGWGRQRSRIYNDRRIDTFDGGFVCRYNLNITEHNGRKSSLQVCVVALCRDGQITRIDEYIDPSKSPAWEERKKREAAEATALAAQAAG